MNALVAGLGSTLQETLALCSSAVEDNANLVPSSSHIELHISHPLDTTDNVREGRCGRTESLNCTQYPHKCWLGSSQAHENTYWPPARPLTPGISGLPPAVSLQAGYGGNSRACLQLINWLVARNKRPTKQPSIVTTAATVPRRGPGFFKRSSERSEQFVAYARLEPPRTSESYLRIIWTAGAVFDDAIICA